MVAVAAALAGVAAAATSGAVVEEAGIVAAEGRTKAGALVVAAATS